MILRFLIYLLPLAPVYGLAQPADKKQESSEVLNPYYNQGLKLFNAGKVEEAARYFTLSIDSNEFLAHRSRFGRGAFYVQTQQWPDAHRDLTEALEVTPDDAMALVMRGLALVSMDSLEAALADANKAMTLDSIVHGMAHAVRGKVFIAANLPKYKVCTELALGQSFGEPGATALFATHCAGPYERIEYQWPNGWLFDTVLSVPGKRQFKASKQGETLENFTEIVEITELDEEYAVVEGIDTCLQAVLNVYRNKSTSPNTKFTVIERDPSVPSKWLLGRVTSNRSIMGIWHLVIGKSSVVLSQLWLRQAKLTTKVMARWGNFFKSGKLVVDQY